MVFTGIVSIKGYMIVFMKIVSIKRGCEMVFVCRLFLLKLIISMRTGYVYAWGTGKNV